MKTPMKKGIRAVIVANGEIHPSDAAWIDNADMVIAADGGTRHCDRFDIVPDLIVGDLDSTDPVLQKKMAAAGAVIRRHPARKDQTDLELAVAEAINRGAATITIIGGLGGRWDMTMATVLGLAAPGLAGVSLRLVAGLTEIILLRGGNRLSIQGQPGDTLSILPLGAEATGVTLKGLDYPLIDATLPAGTALGVSNVLTGDNAEVAIKKGTLLCIHTRRGLDSKDEMSSQARTVTP
ncbi:MAG: thiamine diphosphokinase [Desulfobacterales bacterium]|nr:thiamine diphosphokinase [Desulfobacterales bacterium]